MHSNVRMYICIYPYVHMYISTYTYRHNHIYACMHKYITFPITVVNAHGHELSIVLERFYVTTLVAVTEVVVTHFARWRHVRHFPFTRLSSSTIYYSNIDRYLARGVTSRWKCIGLLTSSDDQYISYKNSTPF